MIDIPSGKAVGIKDLAAFQGVSETYLAKVYTKLRKAGIVRAIIGVNGGYELVRDPQSISFGEIVQAVEGNTPLFQCAEIRQNEILLDKKNLPDAYKKCPCLIKVVMLEAEEQMRLYLNNKTLGWLHKQVSNKIPVDHIRETVEWFNKTKPR